eukprot:8514805-Ditylum_brightwellii.AAC.1
MAGAGLADFFIIFFLVLGAASFAGSLVLEVVLETGAGFVELDHRWQTAVAGWDFSPVVHFFAFLLFFGGSAPSNFICSFFCAFEFSRYLFTTASDFHLPACFKLVIEMPPSVNAVATDFHAK